MFQKAAKVAVPFLFGLFLLFNLSRSYGAASQSVMHPVAQEFSIVAPVSSFTTPDGDCVPSPSDTCPMGQAFNVVSQLSPSLTPDGDCVPSPSDTCPMAQKM